MMCCTLSTRRQTGAPINSWHPAVKRDWPHCGGRTTRRGRVRQSYLRARGYRNSRSRDNEAPVGVRGAGRSQDPRRSYALPRRDSFSSGRQVPEYSRTCRKYYRATYLVRRECCYRVPRAKTTREFVTRPGTEQMNSPAAIGFGRSIPVAPSAKSEGFHSRSARLACKKMPRQQGGGRGIVAKVSDGCDDA